MGRSDDRPGSSWRARFAARARRARGGVRRWRRGLAALALGALAAALAFWASLPPVGELASAMPRTTAYMRLRAREAGRPDDAYAVEPTPLGRVSPLVACAVVKAEDGSFFEHEGFDTAQIRRALGRAARGGPALGASTLSQQLARNLFLSPERTALRKLREATLTYALERRLPKPRLLELYLNVVEWGPELWGVGPAARAYFGKAPEGLDAFEASLLAGLLAAPRAPLAGANLERVAGVQRRVLLQLYASDLVDVGEYAAAIGRVSALRAALGRGLPLPEALREAAAAAPSRALPTLAQLGPPLARAEALETHCGRAHEQAYRARYLELRAKAVAPD
ncbi:MAG TPA: biosynthetic peptidoglycan transglycosylase [Polyangiaceae bacterium]|nr:biosynthetic peptidoglycan transglycosylase [Polyangiaceae bacterium]